MIINKKIKDLLSEIAVQRFKYLNTPDTERKYLRRILKIYDTALTEDERLFIFSALLSQIYYRTIITDPENMVKIHNLQLRYVFIASIIVIFVIVVAAVLLRTNSGVNYIADMFANLVKIITF